MGIFYSRAFISNGFLSLSPFHLDRKGRERERELNESITNSGGWVGVILTKQASKQTFWHNRLNHLEPWQTWSASIWHCQPSIYPKWHPICLIRSIQDSYLSLARSLGSQVEGEGDQVCVSVSDLDYLLATVV